MNLKSWKNGGLTYDHWGQPIFFRVEGRGEALLCLHGFPTATYDWSHVWPALRERFHVIAPDFLGFGFSAKPKAYDYSILDQATLCEGLLARLGVGRVHLLAHDYGVSVAQELLARYEARRRNADPGLELRSICFLNGGLFPEAHRARPIQRLLLTPLGPWISRRMTEATFARSFSAVFGPHTKPSPEELHDFWSLIATDHGERIAHRLIRYVPERKRYRERWVSALVGTEVPLRLVNGVLDPVSGGHVADLYAREIPQADVVRLEDVGHYPQIEDPTAVVRALFAFLGRLGTTID